MGPDDYLMLTVVIILGLMLFIIGLVWVQWAE